MQRKSISRISMIATPIMLVCGLLFTASSVRADDEDTKCTNRTLRGDYGFTAEGVLISTPGLPAQAPFRSVGLAHFDGKGNLTWLEHTVVNGALLGGPPIGHRPAALIASMQIAPEPQS